MALADYAGIASDNACGYRVTPAGLAPPLAPLPHSFGECFEHLYRVVPAEARIGDALAELERLARNKLLAALDQVRFDHRADDALLAAAELRGDIGGDVRLPLALLPRVGVRAGDHRPPRPP